ncbi:recombinase family protein [Rhodobacter capsulatus]|uniref:Recombinase family protein n=1 Tax=Rhodobacter capsulatus TaxID=1061 RepID=A0A4U1JSB9_RHOCA|nr:recombinase family protein [Rhodobacter capsulatus]TKD21963.1 recombinase family protein [Rhodobacter capsulatus]
MATVGYRRVSTLDQSLDRQDIGEVDKLFEEKVSGATAKDRPALQDLIGWVREGDSVVVWSIDRLARNLQDLLAIVQELNAKGVSIRFVKDNLTFPPEGSDGASKLYLSILGAVAEFERSILKQRQAEGIAKAKAKGVYKGRKATIDRDRIKQLSEEGLSTYKIAEVMGISRMTVHRTLNG